MAGTNPGSIAYSRFWTLSPFMAAVGYIGIPWFLDSDLTWKYVIFAPVVFILGVVVRRNRGMAKARRLARHSPEAFLRLWDEGALSLALPASEFGEQEAVCMSPQDDFREFMARRFLRKREANT